ncbi:MAG: hypothetical protein FWC89_00665 [Defluviitaleaceae bacterium]|nr:hypothetical protein [Defluviitaleaceae bacterium]
MIKFNGSVVVRVIAASLVAIFFLVGCSSNGALLENDIVYEPESDLTETEIPSVSNPTAIETENDEDKNGSQSAIYEAWEFTIPNSFADAFAGVEDFGISFTGSVADWDYGWQGIPMSPDEVNFGTIYYQEQPIGLLRDETFLDLGIGNRFRISSENFAFETPHQAAFVVRNERGIITGVNLVDCIGCGPNLVCGDDPFTDYFRNLFAGAFPGVEEFGITFSVSREDWATSESRFIYYQGQVIGTLIDDRRATGGSNWVFTSSCPDSTDIPHTSIYVIRDENENVTGLNVIGLP